MTAEISCDNLDDADVSPFWLAGLPGYIVTEYGSDNNLHYDDTGDDTGDDTMAHIDLDMFTEISRIEITYEGQLAGIGRQ
jgi:hypothetical protein